MVLSCCCLLTGEKNVGFANPFETSTCKNSYHYRTVTEALLLIKVRNGIIDYSARCVCKRSGLVIYSFDNHPHCIIAIEGMTGRNRTEIIECTHIWFFLLGTYFLLLLYWTKRCCCEWMVMAVVMLCCCALIYGQGGVPTVCYMCAHTHTGALTHAQPHARNKKDTHTHTSPHTTSWPVTLWSVKDWHGTVWWNAILYVLYVRVISCHKFLVHQKYVNLNHSGDTPRVNSAVCGYTMKCIIPGKRMLSIRLCVMLTEVT